MRPEIEAHYLGVEWLERGRARRVDVSPEPLEVELGPDGALRVETQIFHDFHPWLGLRLSGQLQQSTPVFVDAQGREHPMLALADGAGGAWWVQDDGWDAVRQRHFSELHRTMGRFEVRIDDHRLLIENFASGLGQAQLDEYLQDFKRDLIWLVLSSGTATTAGARTSFGVDLPAALSDFTLAAARVGSRPARALREIAAATHRSRLRPNAASFRQHARDPASPHLVGRTSEETVDTADNRYMRHMVQVCSRLALCASQAARQHVDRFADRAAFEEERGKAYGAVRSRRVDPEVFDRQLGELTEKLDRLAEYSDEVPDPDGGVHDYRIRITKPYGAGGDQFFFEKPEGRSEFDEKHNISYNVVRLPKSLSQQIISVQSFCKEYTLTGRHTIRMEESAKGRKYRKMNFDSVLAVRPDRQAIEAKMRTRTRLEGKGWRHELSRVEWEEMQHESRTAASRAKVYRKLAEEAKSAASMLTPCLGVLRQQDAHWQSIGVSPQSAFPMGMRYFLSPDYAAVLKAFTRVRELAASAGIGDDSLDKLNRIGILHASAVYERWCLVKIIGVLMEDFGFEPSFGWQEVLIRAVTGRPDSASLLFRREDIGVSALLEIQPVLENGRRPDFRLSFDAAKAVDIGAIVMDAKFRTRWRRGELTGLLTDLVDRKGYGGKRDRVFILQPQSNAIADPSSPLGWGQHCDYGQSAPTNHRTGCIQLAAGTQGGGAQHNLRRLIAMGLQAVFPTPPNSEDEDSGTSMSCCVRCGTRHRPSDIQHQKTRRGKDYWSLGCNHCGMVTVRTHCYDCNQTLFKNGTDLTYHRTLADQITNVMCPSCGAYFDRDFHDS